MVREPLARFVSAFAFCNTSRIAKCPLVANGPPSMKDVVEWFVTQDLHKVDIHWRFQSDFCELHSRLLEYDFLLFYSKSNVNADAICTLKKSTSRALQCHGPRRRRNANPSFSR